MAEMLQNEVRESVLTEKDIKKAYMRWYNCCEISNSYERMQTVSFCYAISSVLKKLGIFTFGCCYGFGGRKGNRKGYFR